MRGAQLSGNLHASGRIHRLDCPERFVLGSVYVVNSFSIFFTSKELIHLIKKISIFIVL